MPNKPGRPPRFGKRMIQKTIRLPAKVIKSLLIEYGTVQAAIDDLVIKPRLRPKPKPPKFETWPELPQQESDSAEESTATDVDT